MPASIARRGFLAAPLLALPAFANDATSQLAELERRNGGRLGVAALDTASGRRVGHRADELFPLQEAAVTLLSPDHTWNGSNASPVAMVEFRAHDGVYQLVYDWQLT